MGLSTFPVISDDNWVGTVVTFFCLWKWLLRDKEKKGETILFKIRLRDQDYERQERCLKSKSTIKQGNEREEGVVATARLPGELESTGGLTTSALRLLKLNN